MSKKDLEILLELLDKYKELLQNDIVMASSLKVSAKKHENLYKHNDET